MNPGKHLDLRFVRRSRHATNRRTISSNTRQPTFHEMQQRFESACSNAPIGMALIDTAGRWLHVNRALCEITGYAEGEVLRLAG